MHCWLCRGNWYMICMHTGSPGLYGIPGTACADQCACRQGRELATCISFDKFEEKLYYTRILKIWIFLRRSRASDRWEELERRKMLSRGFLWRRRNLLTTPTTLIWKEAHGSDQKSKFSDVVESKRKKASNFQTLLFSQTASHSSLQE